MNRNVDKSSLKEQPNLFDLLQLDNNSFEQRMQNYMETLPSSFQKDYGIFYTDLFLAKKMLNELPIFTEATILDPCCGTGSFLYAAFEMKMVNIYGFDIDSEAVELCRKSVSAANVFKLDTITQTGKRVLEKINKPDGVDFVIGNPPYGLVKTEKHVYCNQVRFNQKVKKSGNNLFVAALIRAFELLKPDGILSYIIPKNFLHIHSYRLFRKDLLKDKIIVSIVDIGAYFKNVRGEQIIITIKNSKPANNLIHIKKLDDDDFIDLIHVKQSFYTDEIILFSGEMEKGIYEKLNLSCSTFSDKHISSISRGKSTSIQAIKGKDIRKYGFKKIVTPQDGNQVFIQNIFSSEAGIIGGFGGYLEASQTVTVLVSVNEKICRLILGLLQSELFHFYLYKYCYNNSKLTMHTDASYLKKLPFLQNDNISFSDITKIVYQIEKEEYLSDKWFFLQKKLNKYIYKLYSIESVEEDFIKNELIKICSKKWIRNE